MNDVVIEAWREAFKKINADIFNFTMVKPVPDKWIEETIYLPDSTSVYPGRYHYDWTPYMRQIVNHLHPSDPTRYVSVMKCVQSGATAGLVIPGICYIIDQNPDPILFTGGDLMLAAKTIEERLDPILRSSKLDHNIRPNVIKKANNRSGDTSKKKEFAGGTLTAVGTNSAASFRFYSAKYIFSDDYDVAPRDLGEEGSPKSLMKGRQNSYGDKAKTFFISTPTVTQTSNIYEQYLLGTQNKWNWPCLHCGLYFPLDWQMKCEDGSLAGIVWQLDETKKLILDSVKLRCPHCGGFISENEKYDLNLKGKWIPTVDVPDERRHESYLIPGIALPPGFTGWVTLVEEWLQACPPDEKVVVKLLKAFNNLRLGLPFAETGETPRVNELMSNTRLYLPGTIPDKTAELDANGQIIMLSLACDLNGIMDKDNEDVRLDWELLAHFATGVTYSVDHGSIGTFKRNRDRSNLDKQNEFERVKWTMTHNVKNSVWKEFEEMIRKEYPLESGGSMSVSVTILDIGFNPGLALQFIKKFEYEPLYVFGVKGKVEESYRKLQRDTNPISRSASHAKYVYNVEVNQIKDELSQMMKLREGEDGTQPSGFMNYPQSRDGKYDMKNYFIHYEGERRTEVMKNGEVVGFKWEKKNSQSQNHFWDVRVYGIAAPMIYFDKFKRDYPAYKNYTWEDFVLLVTS